MAGLSAIQYYQVAIIFFLSIGAMSAAAVYLFLKRTEIAPRYRPVVLLSIFFCLIAAGNYVILYSAWKESFTIANGVVTSVNAVYDDTYRYADWLLTVPLQLVAFTLALDTPPQKTRLRAFILALLGAEMIGLGYPGQISTVAETRWLWFSVAVIPFALIIGHLYRGMGADIKAEREETRHLITWARFVLVMCWPVYAAIFVVQTLGHKGPFVFVGTQAAYAVADIGAKIVFAVLLCMAAAAKSAAHLEAQGRAPEQVGARGAASSVPVGRA